VTWSQLDDFFLFFPTFTGVVEVDEGLASLCGTPTGGLPLRSVEGVPLTFVVVRVGTAALWRVGTPFIPFVCTREVTLRDPAARKTSAPLGYSAMWKPLTD